MNDETLPQARQRSQEFLGVLQTASQKTVVEPDEAKTDEKTENQSDLSKVASKQDNKDGRGLHLRLSKFLARNRCGKQPEEISIGSSKTADTRSSVSNGSRIDYSKRVLSSSKFPGIGSQLKRLMKLKSQRKIKTEEEVILVPDNAAVAQKNSIAAVLEFHNQIEVRNDGLGQEKICENAISNDTVKSENPATTDTKNEEESIVSVQSDNENGPAIIAQNPPPVLVAATALTAQFGNTQAEVQIQTSGRNRRDPTEPRTPFLYLQELEPRVETYVQNMFGGERDSVTTGSESNNSVTEVADANEQPEGRDAAEQYYNAVLRAVIRKQFRHLDDEPPIY